MLIGITVSCTQWVLPENCSEPTPTEITLNNVSNTVNCTVGNSSATWILKNSSNTTVKSSSGSVNTFSFAATGEFPPGNYTISASGTSTCGFRFDIQKSYTVICTGSNPTDITYVPNPTNLLTVCTLTSTDNLVGTWTLIDKVSGKKNSIVNGISVDKVTINLKDYPSANYTLEVVGKTKCNTDYTYTKDFKVDYFDLLDFKQFSAFSNSSNLNVKIGINGDIYVVYTIENNAYLLKCDKYGVSTSPKVIGSVSNSRNGGSYITINDVKIDNNDNIFITGNSKSTLGTGGPGAVFGTFQALQGFFVAKINPNGIAQWVKYSEQLQTTFGNSISLGSDGSVNVIGNFSGSGFTLARHAPLNSVGKNDIFIVKYDQNGDFKWINSVGGIDEDFGKGIVASTNGDVFLTGNSADLSSLKFAIGGTVANSKFGNNDMLIIKLDRLSGIPLWVKTAGGAGDDLANSIGIDENSNLYCTGSVSGTATFASTSVGVSASKSLFLTKYNSSGNVVWATSGSCTGDVTSNQVIVDATGNAYLTGVFQKDLAIKTFSKKSSSDNFDSYVAKFSTDGNIQWLESIGGTGSDYANGIVFDNNKNIFVTIDSIGGFTLGGTNYPANYYLWRLDK